MSKETEPIRSRRQMREQSAQGNGATGRPAVPVKPAPKAAASAGAGTGPATGEAAPKVPAVPANAPRSESGAPRGERQSQTRARDRAALRAYKELIDPPGLSPLPSRRTLRQAQLDAERAPVTAVNPVVSVTAPGLPPKGPQTQQSPHVAELAADVAPDTAPQDTVDPAAPPAPPFSAAPPAQAAPPVEPPKGSSPKAASPTAAPRSRAGRRSALATPSKSATPSAVPAKAQGPKHPSSIDVLPTGTTDAATDQAPAQPGTAGDVSAPATPGAAPGDSQSAAAAAGDAAATDGSATDASATGAAGSDGASSKYPPLPGLVPGGSYYPVSAGPPASPAVVPSSSIPPATAPASASLPTNVPPTTEELRVLAAERADAERAAILSERAQARERLAQESAKNRRQPADPTATNNLAMVTPLEFVEVPGVSRPVMRPPTTTHIPIVTRSTPRQGPVPRRTPPAPAPAPSADGQLPGEQSGPVAAGADAATSRPHAQPQPTVANVSAERFDAALAARAGHRPGPGNRPLTGGRSSTLKRAEAMATGGQRTVPPAVGPADVQRSQMPPIPADYAHGLEPLDAVTAGLGRIKRNMLIQWGSVVAGGAALVVGVIMFITALAR